MVAFVDQHRDTYGVEPICAQLPIALSTYFRHKAQQADPTCRSARAQRDDELRVEIQRVWDEQQVYGPRKVWRQLRREQIAVPHCRVRRLMRTLGRRHRPWPCVDHDDADGGRGGRAAGSGEASIHSDPSESALGV